MKISFLSEAHFLVCIRLFFFSRRTSATLRLKGIPSRIPARYHMPSLAKRLSDSKHLIILRLFRSLKMISTKLSLYMHADGWAMPISLSCQVQRKMQLSIALLGIFRVTHRPIYCIIICFEILEGLPLTGLKCTVSLHHLPIVLSLTEDLI